MEEKLNHPDEVTIRTMDSDVKALEQGGGEMVAPQPIKTEPVKSFEIPGYTGPEKPIFTPRPSVAAEKTNERLQSIVSVSKSSNGLKIAGIVVLILLIAAALGFLGYFVVSYLISPQQMPGV